VTGKELRQRREAMGLSRHDLAELLGMSEYQIACWEIGARQDVLGQYWRIFELALDKVDLDLASSSAAEVEAKLAEVVILKKGRAK
jgi:transcriptional regulator with XRE-family HTH domain